MRWAPFVQWPPHFHSSDRCLAASNANVLTFRLLLVPLLCLISGLAQVDAKMATSAKVGGLNVKFYDGSKEHRAQTSEYLDNLLAKYGKVLCC